MLKRFFPILDWLPNYKKGYLTGDISAGLTVGIMLIPQGMAYAMIAGLPQAPSSQNPLANPIALIILALTICLDQMGRQPPCVPSRTRECCL